MGSVGIILLMAAVGAVIGGVTNFLAIKMLFRPHKAIFIGKWRVPFTPGLIPKRRNDLAASLGNTVAEHLLTPKGIQEKLKQPVFKKQLTSWVQQELDQLLRSSKTIKEIAAEWGYSLDEEALYQKLNQTVYQRLMLLLAEEKEKQLSDLLPEELEIKAQQLISSGAIHVQNMLVQYADSYEGRRKLQELIDNFLRGRGFLGSMLSSFLDPDSAVDKIQPVIREALEAEETLNWLKQLLQAERDKVKQAPLEQFTKHLDTAVLQTAVDKFIRKAVPMHALLSASAEEMTASFRERLVQENVPNWTEFLLEKLAERAEVMMEQLHLAEIVEKEVAGFPIERIEELVLTISSREFSLITYLGFFLGGIIGIFQGILALFL